MMDPVSMAFYALVCGGLAASAPRFETLIARLIAGAVTGLIAAAVLPLLRSMMYGS